MGARRRYRHVTCRSRRTLHGCEAPPPAASYSQSPVASASRAVRQRRRERCVRPRAEGWARGGCGAGGSRLSSGDGAAAMAPRPPVTKRSAVWPRCHRDEWEHFPRTRGEDLSNEWSGNGPAGKRQQHAARPAARPSAASRRPRPAGGGAGRGGAGRSSGGVR